MAVTQIQICNSALFKVGADRISSITQNTKSAIILNTIYNHMRDQVLRDHPWNFAIKRTTLAPTSATPDFEYDYEYDLPSDCLRVLYAYPDDIEFVVENGKILSNEDTLPIAYIYKNDDESSWSTDFAEAFAWKLASEVVYPLTQSLPLSDALQKGYARYLAEARSMDGAEGFIKDLEADVWTKSRL